MSFKGLCLASLCSILAILFTVSCAPTALTTGSSSTTAPAATTTTAPLATTATAEKPQYGGSLKKFVRSDITYFDTIKTASGSDVLGVVTQPLMGGDWTKGIAGGYGTKQTDWGASNVDLYDLKTGYVAEKMDWAVDANKNQGTIVVQVRRGIHWSLNASSEASQLVKGRELTADDVVFNLKRSISPGSYLSRAVAELTKAEILKTGSWEVTIKVPLDALAAALTRFGGQTYMQPPEVIAKYGDMQDWHNSVGTGAFMITDYVSGSEALLKRNPNYWRMDPIGPGKGNQLPYLDAVKVLIIADASTQKAALVTGKIDFTNGFSTGNIAWEDANEIRKTAPQLKEKVSESYQGRGTPMLMRTDKVPFNDIRVRKAMMMAVDFNSILDGIYQGKGQIVTWPFAYIPDYAELYLGMDDPGFPPEAKELYSYKPEKAKDLLKQAGYPEGFKTELLITSDEVDYYSIIKNMFGKVGIDMAFKIVEPAVKTNIQNNFAQPALTTGTTGPINNFFMSTTLWGHAGYNASMIDDPVINEGLSKIQQEYPTDVHKAMKDFKELSKYIQTQAYAIPNVIGGVYTFWQPWLRNYSGEWTLCGNIPSWPEFIWYDTTLKRQMGY